MTFRYDIQGLRALAVLLVFIFHLNAAWLPGGFIGVDIFFVISGYLVSSIILHKKEKGTFHFLDFYIGRVKRIFPAFLCVLLFVTVIGSIIYLPMDITTLTDSIKNSFLFKSNTYFSNLGNYFGASNIENPLLHTWTLSIEMQFYFLLPLLIYFFSRKNISRIATLLTAGLLAYSIINSYYFDRTSMMYFSLLARIPEFLIGVLFAFNATSIQKLVNNKIQLLTLISVAGLVICGFTFSESIVFPGFWVLLPCLFTGILLISHGSKVNNFLSHKVFVHIGELSYSIYLWHWVLMAFTRYYTVRTDFYWYEYILITLGTYLLSLLTYHLVEERYRKFSNKSFFFQYSYLLILFIALYFGLANINKEIHPMPLKYIRPSFGLVSHGWDFENVQQIGDLQSQDNNLCLIGDSHALIYKAFFDVIGKNHNFKITTITNDLYPTIPNLKKTDFDKEAGFAHYNMLMKYGDSIIKQSNTIFISSLWSEEVESLPIAFNKFINELPKSKKVIIITDYPTFEKNPIRKTRSIVRSNNHNFELHAKVKELPDYVQQAIKNNDNVYLLNIDYTPFIDNLPYINDTIAYYDGNHLNAYGGVQFGKYYDEIIYHYLIDNKLIQSN